MLVMARSGYAYRYVWSFADEDGLPDDLPNGHSRAKSIVPNRLSI
jgi:hypothetical protein